MLIGISLLRLCTSSVLTFNACPFSVWYTTPGNPWQILPEGGQFSTSYEDPEVGISIKLATQPGSLNISQLEYTWSPAQGMIFYDLSNIDGAPFPGLMLTPSNGSSQSFPTCKQVYCQPQGDSTMCWDVYHQPKDPDTMVCSDETDLSMILCQANITQVLTKPRGRIIRRHHKDYHRRTVTSPFRAFA